MLARPQPGSGLGHPFRFKVKVPVARPLGEEAGIHLRILGVLFRYLVFGKDRFWGTDSDTGPAVNAGIGINVEGNRSDRILFIAVNGKCW
jgi:hypothetical protein